MTFTYQTAVPWGRSFGEYCRMFNLGSRELRLRILGCADGPASFNAEATRRGVSVTSCDPLYSCSREQIRIRIQETYADVMRQTYANQDRFVWKDIRSPEDLGRMRLSAMDEFIDDFDAGKRAGRYVAAELPHLPFACGAFDLVLCSHFLFLYSANLSLEFHQNAVDAMCRVGREVRIFPLLNYDAEPSPFVANVKTDSLRRGREVFIDETQYEFQRGGNRLMRIVSNDPS